MIETTTTTTNKSSLPSSKAAALVGSMDVTDDSATKSNIVGAPTVSTEHHHSSSSSSLTTTTATASSSSSSSVDFELGFIKPSSYTSLRDILPSTGSFVQSPKASSPALSSCEISIRNRLVKQAAWAYLQPMSTSSESDGSTFFYRLWTRFSEAFLRLMTQVFDCLLPSIQIRTTYSRS